MGSSRSPYRPVHQRVHQHQPNRAFTVDNLPANIVLTNLANLSLLDSNSVSLPVTTTAEGKVTGKSLSGVIQLKTGRLTVTIGSGASKVTGHGVILLNATKGGGYFLTKTNAGAIILDP